MTDHEVEYDPVYDNHVTVEMGEWLSASSPVVLSTEGLGPCIGVALHDRLLKRGYLGHFFEPVRGALEEMLERAQVQGVDMKRARAWVSGGYAEEDLAVEEKLVGMKEPILRSRLEILGTLALFGISHSKVEINWIEEKGDSATMELDCQTGECEISFSNHFNDEDLENA